MPCKSAIFLLTISTLHAMDNGSVKIVETERLYARHFTEDDAPQLMPILGDREVMAFTMAEPFNLESIKILLQNNLITSYRTHGWGRYAVIKKDDGALIGFAGLSTKKLSEGPEQVDLGYGFAKRYWGQGYATEIACALIGHAQNKLQIPMLIALIHHNNGKSINVAKKVGFEFWKDSLYHDKPVQVYKLEFKKTE